MQAASLFTRFQTVMTGDVLTLKELYAGYFGVQNKAWIM